VQERRRIASEVFAILGEPAAPIEQSESAYRWWRRSGWPPLGLLATPHISRRIKCAVNILQCAVVGPQVERVVRVCSSAPRPSGSQAADRRSTECPHRPLAAAALARIRRHARDCDYDLDPPRDAAVQIHSDDAANSPFVELAHLSFRGHVVRLPHGDVELAVRADAADPRVMRGARVLDRKELVLLDYGLGAESW